MLIEDSKKFEGQLFLYYLLCNFTGMEKGYKEYNSSRNESSLFIQLFWMNNNFYSSFSYFNTKKCPKDYTMRKQYNKVLKSIKLHFNWPGFYFFNINKIDGFSAWIFFNFFNFWRSLIKFAGKKKGPIT